MLPNDLWSLILSATNSDYRILRYASVSKNFSLLVYQSISSLTYLFPEGGDAEQQQKLKKVVSNIDDQFIQRFVNLTDFRHIFYFSDLSLPAYISKVTDIGLKSLKNLRFLDLTSERSITDEGIKELTQLTTLKLCCDSKITNEGISKLTCLTTLDLNINDMIGDEGIINLTNLTSLHVNSQVTDSGLKYLPNLTFLEIGSNNNVTNEGIRDMIKLQGLSIDDACIVGDEGIKGLTNLKELMIACDNDLITFEGLKNLNSITNLYLNFNDLRHDVLVQQKFGDKIYTEY